MRIHANSRTNCKGQQYCNRILFRELMHGVAYAQGCACIAGTTFFEVNSKDS